ncbi:MAG: late competence development ComFB family protein [bacterium]
MAILKSYDLDSLKNANEEMVLNYIEEYINNHQEPCRCRDCVLDIAAFALNSLKPAYNVSTLHANKKEIGASPQEIEKAVKKAIKVVTQTPHHLSS